MADGPSLDVSEFLGKQLEAATAAREQLARQRFVARVATVANSRDW